MDTTRIGMGFHSQFMNGTWDKALRYVREAKPRANLVMDGFGEALRLKDTHPDGMVFHRDFQAFGEPDDRVWRGKSARDVATWYKRSHGDKRVGCHMLNEPGASNDEIPKLMRWCIDFVNEMLKDGYPVVIGNFAIANWNEHQLEAGLFDDFIREMGRLTRAGAPVWVGMHEYTCAIPAFGTGVWQHPDTNEVIRNNVQDLLNPTLVQPEWWLRDVKISKWGSQDNLGYPPYWHMLRSLWWIIRARERGWDDFKIGLTELAHDGMPDLQQWHTFTHNGKFDHIYAHLRDIHGANGYPELKGHDTFMQVFEHWYNARGWSPQRALAEQLIWMDTIYPDVYDWFTVFAWTYNSPWHHPYGHNLAHLDELQSHLITYGKDKLKGTPMAIPPVLPDDQWREVKVTGIPSGAKQINIRNQPDTSALDVGDVFVGDVLQVEPDTQQVMADGYTWRRVRKGATNGWAATLFTFADVPLFPPPVPTPPDTSEVAALVRATFLQAAIQLEAIDNRLATISVTLSAISTNIHELRTPIQNLWKVFAEAGDTLNKPS